MIPKIIHYCWFGNNPKPEVVTACIASWKRVCPDWEIQEWNESNFNISTNHYMKEAYDCQKWAFVSDVARLITVYTRGGVYLDTDIELKSSLNELLHYNAFFAFETEFNINTGLGFGAVQGNMVVKAMIDSYNNRNFIINGKLDMTPCPSKNTEVLMKIYKNFKRNGQPQVIEGTKILGTNEYHIYAVNHTAASWVEGKIPKRQAYKDLWIKRFLRKPSHVEMIQKFFGKKIFKVYIFFVYDFLENGFFYYVKRIIEKKR